LHLTEECAKELENKLKAGEKYRSDVETKAASAEHFRDRLHAVESSLSEREKTNFPTRSHYNCATQQTIHQIFEYCYLVSSFAFFIYVAFMFIPKSSPFFQQKNLVRYIPETKTWKKMHSRIPSRY
jgi:hypothetical protein